MAKAVVIVHGLYMNAFSMKWLEKHFRQLGYNTYNFSYVTRQYSSLTLNKLHQLCTNVKEDELFFLGHSMGGLVIHQYLSTYPMQALTLKVVTLGTPYNGSVLANHLHEKHLSAWLFGQSSTKNILLKGVPDKLTFPTGSIIGTKNFGIGRLFGITDGDGTVAYRDVHANWVTDEAFVNTNHFGLLHSKKAVELANHFFMHNHF